jgi:hypothetical protein
MAKGNRQSTGTATGRLLIREDRKTFGTLSVDELGDQKGRPLIASVGFAINADHTDGFPGTRAIQRPKAHVAVVEGQR